MALPSDDPRIYETLVAGIRDYAIFILDPEGVIRTWNLGARLIKGYAAEEVIGRHFSIFYPRDALDRQWPERELRMAAADGRFEDEGWRVRKDGSRFWANVVITALRREDGRMIGYSKVTRDLTIRRGNEEKLRQSEERFRLLIEGVQVLRAVDAVEDARGVGGHAVRVRMKSVICSSSGAPFGAASRRDERAAAWHSRASRRAPSSP